MPVAHGEGAYYADDATLDELEATGQVLFRYVRRRRVGRRRRGGPGEPERLAPGDRRRDERAPATSPGLMPHPETAVEAVLGSDDGLGIIASFVASAAERERAGGPARVTAAVARMTRGGGARGAPTTRSRSIAGSA